MHIPDGILSPAVSLATGAVSIGVVGYCIRRLNDSLSDRTIPLTGMMSAVIFAGQMVNFPLGGTSGHLLGGVLAATVLGPWAGCVALTTVLLVQCLLFADGGIFALGANILHMGVLGSMGGYVVMSFIRRRFRDHQRGTLAGAVIASWLSVMAAAAVFCVEVFLSQRSSGYEFRNFFTLMVAGHALIGIGEALITGAALRVLFTQRPDLIYRPDSQPPVLVRVTHAVTVGGLLALAIAAFLSPFASSLPDGYEAVAEQTGLDEFETSTPLILSDYDIPKISEWGWQSASVAISGVIGVTTVLIMASVMSRVYAVTSTLSEPADDSSEQNIQG